jgi:hypothetical protein
VFNDEGVPDEKEEMEVPDEDGDSVCYASSSNPDDGSDEGEN